MAETRQSVMVFLLLIHLNFFAKANVSCPGYWVSSEESSSCIRLFIYLDGDYSWYDARDKCGFQGGDLVTIVNQAMNDFIYDMAMSDSDFYKQSEPWTWIGLNDPYSDYTWVWLDEVYQAAWTNWISGQPDGSDQDCVVLDADYFGEWRDITCDYEYPWYGESYICEIPALTTTLATTTTTMTISTAVTTVTTPATSTAVTTVTTPATSTSLATTSTTTSSLLVARETSSGGLSVAAIAGIVTGVLVVAALVPAVFFTIRYFKNRQRNDHSVAYTNREAKVTVG